MLVLPNAWPIVPFLRNAESHVFIKLHVGQCVSFDWLSLEDANRKGCMGRHDTMYLYSTGPGWLKNDKVSPRLALILMAIKLGNSHYRFSDFCFVLVVPSVVTNLKLLIWTLLIVVSVNPLWNNPAFAYKSESPWENYLKVASVVLQTILAFNK